MKFRFCRAQRILKTDDFSSVFRLRNQRSNAWFQVLYRPNNLAHARLGLVVSKKISKRAVDRNFIKRTVRELFRLHASELSHVDIVVRSRQKFNRQNAATARAALHALLRKQAQCRASSSS